MNIYFTASILQRDELGDNYKKIVAILEKAGHTVKADHILNPKLAHIKSESREMRIAFYQQVTRWIAQADLVVAEVSFPSTVNIGHEISIAINKAVPVIAIYQPDRSPLFVLGIEHEKVFWSDYTDHDLAAVLKEGVSYCTSRSKTRFNLLLSSKHLHYLESVTEGTGIAKAAYIRKMIEKEMNDGGA